MGLTLQHKRSIAAPSALLWNTFTNLAEWPNYVPGLAGVLLVSGTHGGVGTCVLRYSMVGRAPIDVTTETLVWEPHRRLVTQVSTSAMTVRGETRLATPEDPAVGSLRDAAPGEVRTELTYDCEVTPQRLMVKLTKFLWASRVEDEQSRLWDSFKRYVESRALAG